MEQIGGQLRSCDDAKSFLQFRHVGNSYTSREKGFSHSNIPQFDVDNADQNQPVSSQRNDQETKDTMKNNGRKFRRIHYSGQLMPPGGNIEDMLKEHERHIQAAVRKARTSKGSR